MNWVDMALIGTLAAGGLFGLWIGMVRASFSVLGVIAGFVVVARYRDDAASWLYGYLANETVVDILSYAVTISATVAVTVVAAGIARKLVYGMFMGWADRLTGMTAGLAVGAAVAGIAVMGMAGFSYANDSLNGGNGGQEGLAGRVLAYTPYDAGDLSGLETKLTASSLVAILVSAADIIPDRAFAVVPEDWRDALDTLERRLERMGSARR